MPALSDSPAPTDADPDARADDPSPDGAIAADDPARIPTGKHLVLWDGD